MAHRFLLKSSHRGCSLLVSYHGNFQSVQTLVRGFASQSGRNKNPEYELAPPECGEASKPLTVEPPMGLLGPLDVRLPLPGNLGLGCELDPALGRRKPGTLGVRGSNLPLKTTLLSRTDVLTAPTNHERQAEAVRQFLDQVERAEEEELAALSESPVRPAALELECAARDCNKKMKKEFAPLFPERDIRGANLTALTLCQRTMNDMSFWSEAMDNEREELTLHFVTLAKEVCEQLQAAGHWADFIDPSSSQPYFGAHTNDTLAETDDRMRTLGLDIQDMGCCKVVFHPEWKAHVFVGCLFTNAPLDDPLIKEILNKRQES